MKSSVFKVGSPWGGLITLHLKENLKGDFKIQVKNCVKAPTFILGTTTNEQWNGEIKHYAPKWAVLRIPGQLDIYVQSLKVKSISDMEGSLTRIKKSMDVLEQMLGLPAGSRPGAHKLIFASKIPYPIAVAGVHFGKCTPGVSLVGDRAYPLGKGEKFTRYDDFFNTLGTSGLIGHEFGHGFCYEDLPDAGNQWAAELVGHYQRWTMNDAASHSPENSWRFNSTKLDF